MTAVFLYRNAYWQEVKNHLLIMTNFAFH